MKPPGILKIDHLGIATRAIDEKLPFWKLLGLEPAGREVVEGQKVSVTFLPVGDSTLELLEPTDPGSPIAKALASRGEGIHHLCLLVEGIDPLLETLRAAGVPLINEVPVPGAHGARVAFVHPKGTGGILVELSEKPTTSTPPCRATIELGEVVLLNCINPKEQLWGRLGRLDPTGVALRGLDLRSFDDWMREIARHPDECTLGLATTFVPLFRIERIFLDERVGLVPSYCERFEQTVGRPAIDFLGRED
jgi:methylmalonyl-CoA epimerase